jgi:hypothetical protein
METPSFRVIPLPDIPLPILSLPSFCLTLRFGFGIRAVLFCGNSLSLAGFNGMREFRASISRSADFYFLKA